MQYKVGLGYDVHKFVKGRPLVLGGVSIPYEQGLEGHSDADVLLHAVCDALLGALGLGDIGEHFPNTDEQYKDISSLELLKKVNEQIIEQGLKIGNIDAVILAEEPNLKDHKEKMRSNIADCLNIEASDVNIKATTNEGLGFIGRKEGIAAHAVALLTL